MTCRFLRSQSKIHETPEEGVRCCTCEVERNIAVVQLLPKLLAENFQVGVATFADSYKCPDTHGTHSGKRPIDVQQPSCSAMDSRQILESSFSLNLPWPGQDPPRPRLFYCSPSIIGYDVQGGTFLHLKIASDSYLLVVLFFLQAVCMS